jgi:hypothetical protein
MENEDAETCVRCASSISNSEKPIDNVDYRRVSIEVFTSLMLQKDIRKVQKKDTPDFSYNDRVSTISKLRELLEIYNENKSDSTEDIDTNAVIWKMLYDYEMRKMDNRIVKLASEIPENIETDLYNALAVIKSISEEDGIPNIRDKITDFARRYNLDYETEESKEIIDMAEETNYQEGERRKKLFLESIFEEKSKYATEEFIYMLSSQFVENQRHSGGAKHVGKQRLANYILEWYSSSENIDVEPRRSRWVSSYIRVSKSHIYSQKEQRFGKSAALLFEASHIIKPTNSTRYVKYRSNAYRRLANSTDDRKEKIETHKEAIEWIRICDAPSYIRESAVCVHLCEIYIIRANMDLEKDNEKSAIDNMRKANSIMDEADGIERIGGLMSVEKFKKKFDN